VAAETLAVDLEVRPYAELGTDPHPLPGAAVRLALIPEATESARATESAEARG
jgi:hypothetical protein